MGTKYYECVSAFFRNYQASKVHAPKFMRIVICALPVLPYFSTLSHRRNDSPAKKLYWVYIFLLFLQILSETFLSLRTIPRDIINVQTSSFNAAGILITFQRNLRFLDRFSKSTGISNVMKIRLVRAELFCGRANKHGEFSSTFSEFWDHA
jgi:hypothetical protein